MLVSFLFATLNGQSLPDFFELDSLLDNGGLRRATVLLEQAPEDHPGILYRRGRAQALLGDFPSAVRLLQKAQDAATSARDSVTLVRTHAELARLYRSQEVDSASFYRHVRLATDLAFATQQKELQALGWYWSGMALLDRLLRAEPTDLRRWGYADSALDYFSAAARAYRSHGDLPAAALARSRRGAVYERIGLPDSAIIYAQECLRTVEQMDAVGAAQQARIRLATGYLVRQDSASLCTALPLWREALSYARAHELEYDERLDCTE